MLFVGLMSGTSLDGADAVLARFDADDRGVPEVVAAAHRPFEPDLRRELLALQATGPDELQRAALAANRLVDDYASLVATVCEQAGVDRSDVVAIGAHGQTVRHRPDLGFTIQLNAPARLAERTGIAVVADFRSRDVAAGGQGAPLVPAFHERLFRDPTRHRVVINLGGIGNVTDLPADVATPVRGWDCGPGNVLLDGWIARHRDLAFDADGAWAASGRVHDALLDALLAEPWFARPPPKSTGRDLFGERWLDARRAVVEPMPPADVQATLAELTARSLVDSIVTHAGAPDEAIVCGGGARNGDLLARVAARFHAHGGATRVLRCSDAEAGGHAPEHIEALAFAWLAKRCLAAQPGNLPAVTGAAGPRILGAVYPR